MLALTVLFVTDVYAQRSRTGTRADSTRTSTVEHSRASERSRTDDRTKTDRARPAERTPAARGRTGRAETSTPPSRTERSTTRQRTPPGEGRTEQGSTRRQPRGDRQEEARSTGRDRPPPSSTPPRVQRQPERPVRHNPPRHHPPRHIPPPAHRPAPPPVVVDVRWPWEQRYRAGWSPRYRYRQRVYVRTGHGVFRRAQEMDVHTTYRQRVHYASRGRAEVEVEVERIELYRNGRFLGEVHHLPRRLSRVTARIDRGDRVTFDRDLFLVGTPSRGFELVVTRHYTGYVLGAYERGHEVDAGVLDFRRERVVPVRNSRLFDPYGRSPLVPIPLIPDDPDLLLDYGWSSHVTHRRYDDGRYEHRGDTSPYRDNSDDVDVYFREDDARGAAASEDVQVRTREQHMRTRRGDEVLLKREMKLERIE